MPASESFGLLIALRELNGFTYLGRGRWRDPEWVTKQRKNRKKR
jgi:hypothetical protein